MISGSWSLNKYQVRIPSYGMGLKSNQKVVTFSLWKEEVERVQESERSTKKTSTSNQHEQSSYELTEANAAFTARAPSPLRVYYGFQLSVFMDLIPECENKWVSDSCTFFGALFFLMVCPANFNVIVFVLSYYILLYVNIISKMYVIF